MLFGTVREAGARTTFVVHLEFVALGALGALGVFAEQISGGLETFVQTSDAPKIGMPM